MVEGSNRDIVIKGLVDYENLEGHEKIAFDSLMLGIVTVIEAALTSNDAGLLDDEQPDSFAYYIRTRLLPYSDMRDWWVDTKDIFSPAVQDWVPAQISMTDMESNFLGSNDLRAISVNLSISRGRIWPEAAFRETGIRPPERLFLNRSDARIDLFVETSAQERSAQQGRRRVAGLSNDSW